ncbi:2073_t:CDS:2 [Paraglomus brasilianum]|uniref:2073_t:CDS:1 n=1 Tax=Paraglomus brasilianum TaxID=144538 RepID=A0A9N9F3U8_9GLOM|nr:2073_t:CDS:2 [Paraglomus brasilianum]
MPRTPTTFHRWVEKMNKVWGNLLHQYPEIPKFLTEEDLPFQIGENITVKDYNTFLDRNESSGYKFYWNNKKVYIIEMANRRHESVTTVLSRCFDRPNNGAIVGPLEVSHQPFHHNPVGQGEKIAPDLAVCPIDNLVQPTRPHPGFPRSDYVGLPHARIICEVADTQTTGSWNTKCEAWMHEEYVRCVFGVKLYPEKTLQTTVHRAIIARLWVRREIPGSVLSSNTSLVEKGVYVKEWECGTIRNNSSTLTNCNAPDLDAFKVTIPVSNVFWDPPIVHGVPKTDDYAVVVPDIVVGNNFVIDLYDIQRVVLRRFT